jgi:hypothetical protein
MDNLREIQSVEQPTVQRQLARLRELEAKKAVMFAELEFSMLLRGMCGQHVFDHGSVRVRIQNQKATTVIVTDGNGNTHYLDFDALPLEQQSRLLKRRAR